VPPLARLVEGQLGSEAGLARMLLAPAGIVAPRLFDKRRTRIGFDERLRYADGTRSVLHVDDWPVILRLDLHSRVRRRRCRAADQQRQLELLALHLRRHVNHLIE
jgi:hypothetical protein